jgi:hypothetical protein
MAAVLMIVFVVVRLPWCWLCRLRSGGQAVVNGGNRRVNRLLVRGWLGR